ncbi:MAG: tRNA (adenosine(37)-N6)-threonylcarbamoyltransferase complex ATPase subunit type 1 TsaE, partial [Pseudomonadales bacterium]|nr:tRNA (adenosine(37)-N6)-threonylcarbamoyltransferase complex ATPase subunit type 1 TsaE [Pseudomonadales bacterium]
GELGAGKTTFARGALTALGAAPPIKSPSYALLEIYTLESLVALHLDLYRLIDPAELEQLGLRDYHRPQHLWLIEWPERGTGHLPVPDLELRFYVRPQGHRIEAQSCSEAGAVTLNTARMATRH